MSRSFIAITVVAGIALGGAASAQEIKLTLDDFVPPAAGGPTKVSGEVKKEDGLTVAASAQDGLADAYKTLLETGDDGVEEIVVPSGFAVLSVATEGYRVYDNRNATLLSKRAAYTRATARAQTQLVENFNGLTTACERAISTSLESRDGGSGENRTNVETLTEESCDEQVRGVLRGYVTYAVRDNAPEASTVTVALASSTATRRAAERAGGAVTLADDTRRAWDTLMSEITSEAVSPVGARMIVSASTGDTIVIGYGSAIVRTNDDPNVAGKLRQSAERQAQMRANNALISFMKGDEVYWDGHFDESQVESAEQFEYVAAPSAKDLPEGSFERLKGLLLEQIEAAAGDSEAKPGVRLFDGTRNLFLNTLRQTDQFTIVTKGQLPPGVKKKAFVQENGDWAIAVAVYSDSLTRQVTGDAGASTAPVEPGKGMPGGLNPNAENPAGPGGQVTKKGDL